MSEQTKRIVSLSPSTLDTIQGCMRAYKFGKIDHLTSLRNAEALDFGGLFHKIIHPYYFGRIPPEFRKEHHYNHPYAPLLALNYKQLVDACREIGLRYSLLTDLDIAERNECIELFSEYATTYAGDGWRTKEVEQPFTVKLYEDEELIILFRGIMDWYGNIPQRGDTPVDHKTGSRDSDNSKLRNQFIGSSFVFNSNQFVENKILRIKNDKFRREAHYYDDEQKIEWLNTAIYWGKQLDFYITHNTFPANNSSCRFCFYRRICETPPSVREGTILRLYKQNNVDHDIYKLDKNLVTVIKQVLGSSNASENTQAQTETS